MKKISVILVLLTILTKITGFAREIVLSYFYGASGTSDAYLISLTIPSTIFAFIGTGIATGFIPTYSKIVVENDLKYANKFTNNFINFILIGCTIIILTVFFFTMPIVKIFASGFEGEVLDLAVLFTRISILSIYFSGLIFVFNSYLQIKNNFIIPVIAGIPLNIFTTFSILLSAKSNLVFISIGSTLAVFVQFLFIVPFVINKGYKYSFILNRNDKYLRQMISLSIPVIIGVSVNQINVLVDRTIASQISIGGISSLNYANRLNLFVQGIFVLSIVSVMYPMISKMVAENNMIGFKKTLSEAINLINLLVLPTMVGAMIFAEPVVKLLFGRGAFDLQAISMTSNALFFYSIGMIGFALREVLSRAFYSLQDAKTPMINAAIAMLMNITLNIILSKFLGIGGLALATSISAIFCTLLLFVNLKKKISRFGLKKIIISFIKILCSSLIMGIVSKIAYNFLLSNINPNLSLIFAVGVGIVIYFITIYFMNIEDVNVILKTTKRKLKTIS